MRIHVNGQALEPAARTLRALLVELGYEDAKVGTAVNHEFVREKDRATTMLNEDDAVEIVAPRQGG
jgi:sulfur carrier protein